ncbi:MAG: DNA recombination protein RmuC [Treponema sp.]|jgi:DNA recombination protein RmuC|nr:DNA recombination protein RmuC [Treponema sp.]
MEYGFIQFIILAVVVIQFILIMILLLKNRQNPQDHVVRKLTEYDQRLDKNESSIRDEFGRNREETNKSAKESREELSLSLRSVREELAASLKSFEEKSSSRIEALGRDTKDSLERNRETVERKLADIQRENGEKLEKMRLTVDEKLHNTLEKRLNESFQMVNSQLESVQKGLGEMQALATGVGDLKKVITNVSQRGQFGESQLGAILEQMLSNEQFEKQVVVKENSSERVDYAIKLPNKNDVNEALLLPVDSKYPIEDYQRLINAYENLSKEEIASISKDFESTIKKEAKRICEKYINPPRTTDFALMFVPTEGLFAEIIKRTSLCETLRREYKITIVGPTNFAALLNSLQMGFQTLAIEKRSSEVWKTLGAVKTGFRNFGEALANTKKKLVAATNEIDNVETKSRTIERKLKSVEELPVSESTALIGNIDIANEQDDE